MKIIKSINNTPIRIPQEQLFHIYQGHPEMKGCENLIVETLSNPDRVLEGDDGALMAVKKFQKSPVSQNKYLVEVYKESADDGFVITAYFTRRLAKWRKIRWQR